MCVCVCVYCLIYLPFLSHIVVGCFAVLFGCCSCLSCTLLLVIRLGCLNCLGVWAVVLLTLFVAFKSFKKQMSNQSLFSPRMKQLTATQSLLFFLGLLSLIVGKRACVRCSSVVPA